MSLSRKILVQHLTLMAGLLLVGGACLWGLNGLRDNVSDALNEYGDIHEIESIQGHVALATNRLTGDAPQVDPAREELRAALSELEVFQKGLDEEFGAPDQATRERDLARQATQGVTAALAQLDGKGSLAVGTTLGDVSSQLADIHRICQEFVRGTQESANKELHVTILVIALLSLAVLGAVIFVSISQYRSIMRPLTRLREGVRAVAAGGFSQRLPVSGDREFAELSEEFNRMAAELDQFYHQLEQRVAAKSKELVRSERLASIGFLAAGVAHEINNPLSIISGYAELSLKRMTPEERAGVMNDIRRSLQIIRDEAFRCKEITEKLLTLARGHSDKRETLSLAQITRDVAAIMSGLKNYREKKLVVSLRDDELLRVDANATEMKQVLLNMTVNALEAVRAGDGEVCIEGRRNNGWVELCVRDNGRGMTPATLERVFEPFYTEKRGAGEPGTGLGLSITHAIIESHGGRIRAESDGPGHGSTFVIQLPASCAAGKQGITHEDE